jgi:prevent-host-death family protein
MGQTKVGIRELKTRLGRYVRKVKAGDAVVITERGKPVGLIVPMGLPVESRMKELAQSGLIAWSGRKLRKLSPVARTRGRKTVAELLLQDRA